MKDFWMISEKMKEKSDYVVLSPVGYKDTLVGVRLERVQLSSPSEVPDVVYSGQGIHTGIVVRSAQNSSENLNKDR
ncbi:hypothetical protein D918_07535 [Trichuris suis]|nr:hypothetical protein D918_07535 [Trichuris suis]